MRLTAPLITALIIGLASRTPAAAEPENRDAFAKRIARYAAADPARPKGLCLCHDTYDRTGYVVLDASGTTVNVSCRIPEFDYMTGAPLDDYITCAVKWDVLGK